MRSFLIVAYKFNYFEITGAQAAWYFMASRSSTQSTQLLRASYPGGQNRYAYAIITQRYNILTPDYTVLLKILSIRH